MPKIASTGYISNNDGSEQVNANYSRSDYIDISRFEKLITGAAYDSAFNAFYNSSKTFIESFTVLKDAVSTAIYGADGANGVILVTLKKGRQGRTNVNASVRYGITNMDMSTAPKMLNAQQYMELAWSASP